MALPGLARTGITLLISATLITACTGGDGADSGETPRAASPSSAVPRPTSEASPSAPLIEPVLPPIQTIGQVGGVTMQSSHYVRLHHRGLRARVAQRPPPRDARLRRANGARSGLRPGAARTVRRAGGRVRCDLDSDLRLPPRHRAHRPATGSGDRPGQCPDRATRDQPRRRRRRGMGDRQRERLRKLRPGAHRSRHGDRHRPVPRPARSVRSPSRARRRVDHLLRGHPRSTGRPDERRHPGDDPHRAPPSLPRHRESDQSGSWHRATAPCAGSIRTPTA